MTLRRVLWEFCWKLQRVVAPALKDSQLLYEDALRAHAASASAWLDLGCGHHVLAIWRRAQEAELVAGCRMVVGVDYALDSLKRHRSIPNRVRGDVARLPFKDASFDLVTANMVVEHLDRPEAQFKEVRRVLKPAGCFVFHTPNVLGYTTLGARLVPERLKRTLVHLIEGRRAEDVFPTWYRANSAFRIGVLARETGFDVRKVRLAVTVPEFAILPPVVIVELLWIRLLMAAPFRALRTNIIAVLQQNRAALAR